jgi:hypothetical protein
MPAQMRDDARRQEQQSRRYHGNDVKGVTHNPGGSLLQTWRRGDYKLRAYFQPFYDGRGSGRVGRETGGGVEEGDGEREAYCLIRGIYVGFAAG